MRRSYSYADQKSQRYRSRGAVLVVLIFVVFYIFFTSVFFSMRVLENDTMAPNLRKGERFVFFSYGLYKLIPGLDLERGPMSLHRGNIVLIDMFREKPPGVFYRILDGVSRFFTAQRISLLDREEHLFVKRVIGLPGDEITMTNL